MILRDLSSRFRRSIIRFVEEWASPARPAPEPEAVAAAKETLRRASDRRHTRAVGAALATVKRARTEALRREVEAMRRAQQLQPAE